MRDEVAIVELDTAPHAAAIQAAMQTLREARQHEGRAAERLVTAQQATARARLDLGRVLAAARELWPTRGPRAKGWGEFLAEQRVDQDVALDAMQYAGFVEERFPGTSENVPGNLPTLHEAGLDPRPRQDKPANVFGGSKDPNRGKYCTPKKWADAVGCWGLDPFSNPRSHIVADRRCMLEDGGNGLLDKAVLGSYSAPPAFGRADESTSVWIQPPYEIVDEAIAHYGHTRFCALLRWAPDTDWFELIWKLTRVVCFPLERLDFEPPPGIQTSANPFPHAFYYSHFDLVTDEMRKACLVWHVQHGLSNAA